MKFPINPAHDRKWSDIRRDIVDARQTVGHHVKVDLSQAQEVHTSLVGTIRSNKARPFGCKFKAHGSTRKTSSPHDEHRATRYFSKSFRKISDGMMYSRGHSADDPFRTK